MLHLLISRSIEIEVYEGMGALGDPFKALKGSKGKKIVEINVILFCLRIFWHYSDQLFLANSCGGGESY